MQQLPHCVTIQFYSYLSIFTVQLFNSLVAGFRVKWHFHCLLSPPVQIPFHKSSSFFPIHRLPQNLQEFTFHKPDRKIWIFFALLLQDVVEKTLHDIGMGSMNELHQMYRDRVVLYHAKVRQETHQLYHHYIALSQNREAVNTPG